MNIAVRSTEQAVLVRLREENEELREQVLRLQEALSGADIGVSRAWRLTGSEARLYRDLARKPIVRTKEQLHFALYGMGDDDPDQKIVDVMICKLRGKIEIFGGEIETVWGEGYRLAVAPAEPCGFLPRAAKPMDGAVEMIAVLSTFGKGNGGLSAGKGVGKLFVAIVRHLAAAQGQTLTSQRLADAIYSDWPAPKDPKVVIWSTIRRGRPILKDLGWEIDASAGKGGGYRLRQSKRSAA